MAGNCKVIRGRKVHFVLVRCRCIFEKYFELFRKHVEQSGLINMVNGFGFLNGRVFAPFESPLLGSSTHPGVSISVMIPLAKKPQFSFRRAGGCRPVNPVDAGMIGRPHNAGQWHLESGFEKAYTPAGSFRI